MGILAVLAGAKKGAEDSDEEAPASERGEPKAEKSGYRTLIKEAAEDGDWDAFADAVAGLCKQSMSMMPKK